jgi:uncharacterized lipoprotein YajG
MNPIVKMMKSYIKMPLKYALSLLFICALALSATTGCTTQDTTQSVVNQSADQSGQQTATNPISVTAKAAGTSMAIGSFYTPQSGYRDSVERNKCPQPVTPQLQQSIFQMKSS